MRKIILISAYFGTFPANFGIWLKSAGANADIDFLIFSDCSYEKYLPLPENIKIVYVTFDELRERFQQNFDFNIKLNAPYKLCDFRPSFGCVLKDEIEGYDYWGHIDIDTVIGNIRKFLPERDYDKIYQAGHLTLYRNTPENNCRFMLDGGLLNYREVFTTERSCIFDEVGGMQEKFEYLGIPTYISRDYADITKRNLRFTLSQAFIETSNKSLTNYPYQIFYYENGGVFRDYFIGDKLFCDEYNYIHFSTRKLQDFTDGADSFYITNKGFFPKGGETTKEIIEKYNAYNPALDLKENKKWARDDKKKRLKNIYKRVFERL